MSNVLLGSHVLWLDRATLHPQIMGQDTSFEAIKADVEALLLDAPITNLELLGSQLEALQPLRAEQVSVPPNELSVVKAESRYASTGSLLSVSLFLFLLASEICLGWTWTLSQVPLLCCFIFFIRGFCFALLGVALVLATGSICWTCFPVLCTFLPYLCIHMRRHKPGSLASRHFGGWEQGQRQERGMWI